MLREHLSPLQLICLAAALCINAEGTSTQVRCTSAAATSSPRPAGLGGFCVRLRGGEGEGGEGGWGGWRRKVMGQTEQEERTLQAARFESLLDLEGRYSAQTKRHEEERESRIKSVQAIPAPALNDRCGWRTCLGRGDCCTKLLSLLSPVLVLWCHAVSGAAPPNSGRAIHPAAMRLTARLRRMGG